MDTHEKITGEIQDIWTFIRVDLYITNADVICPDFNIIEKDKINLRHRENRDTNEDICLL